MKKLQLFKNHGPKKKKKKTPNQLPDLQVGALLTMPATVKVRKGLPEGTATADLQGAPMCGPGASPRCGNHVRLVLRWKNAIRAQRGCQ